MDKELLASWCSDFTENFADNIWKIAPFRAGNRAWFVVLMKGYFSCIVGCGILACVLNSIEGDKWVESTMKIHVTAKGNTALDECFWFVFTTVHGIGFGEFNARGVASRVVACTCVSIGYWFTIFLMGIVMLANLPGERVPTLWGVMKRMVGAVWPSYMIFMFLTAAVGSTMGPYLSKDPWGFGWGNGCGTGIYWMWTTTHRMPYGDMWPDTSWGRTVTVFAAMIGLLYMPYALALVAVRCPTAEQHESLLGNLRKHPENALGRGYIVPTGANVREVVMEEYTPDANI
jgi:hypothetical protein